MTKRPPLAFCCVAATRFSFMMWKRSLSVMAVCFKDRKGGVRFLTSDSSYLRIPRPRVKVWRYLFPHAVDVELQRHPFGLFPLGLRRRALRGRGRRGWVERPRVGGSVREITKTNKKKRRRLRTLISDRPVKTGTRSPRPLRLIDS